MIATATPSIFNDAIGPVMVGPSSSHTAGSHRIGSVLRQMAGGLISKAEFIFHPEGSLATTYQTQGSDIGLAAGLAGMDIIDPKMPEALLIAADQGMKIIFSIRDYKANHPNTYWCHITTQSGEQFEATALSTGGGLIQFIAVNGFPVSLNMDLPVLLVQGIRSEIEDFLTRKKADNDFMNQVFNDHLEHRGNTSLLLLEFNQHEPVMEIGLSQACTCKLIHPVYPVLGYSGSLLPFAKAADIEADSDLGSSSLAELAISYESARSLLSHEVILEKMEAIIELMKAAIDVGLSGTSYSDRILQSQSPQFLKAMHQNTLLPDGPLSRMAAYTMAIMEAKSAMKVIVAAPTAGSAGGLPGALIGLAEELQSSREELVSAFLAAGLIGVFISKEGTFAAEVAGCQAETGAGASMAAAGMIQLAGGSAKQAMGAASLALQNVMGLICDPVGNRVEIPCLGRNVQAGANALTSANMILGGVDPVIPLSEAIASMLAVGQALPRELRCTALGGLAVTPTAKNIENKLNNKLLTDADNK